MLLWCWRAYEPKSDYFFTLLKLHENYTYTYCSASTLGCAGSTATPLSAAMPYATCRWQLSVQILEHALLLLATRPPPPPHHPACLLHLRRASVNYDHLGAAAIATGIRLIGKGNCPRLANGAGLSWPVMFVS